MPKMCLFLTENASVSLRGKLSRWMLELKPGVFLGTLSQKVRHQLWTLIQSSYRVVGAFMIEPAQNEQKFRIHTYGNVSRTVVDMEGLQLISIPSSIPDSPTDTIKTKIRKKYKLKKKIKQFNLHLDYHTYPSLNLINWEIPPDFPMNFIHRYGTFYLEQNKLQHHLSGISSYYEYPLSLLWQPEQLTDVFDIIFDILTLIKRNSSLTNKYQNYSIGCLDIETTDYLPKAKEGFVNIIGLVQINFPPISTGSSPIPTKLKLRLDQVFNMHRLRDQAHKLIEVVLPELASLDLLLVFNKEFDIAILQKLCEENNISLPLPNKIIDLQDDFISLANLEQFLGSHGFSSRIHSEKGKYSSYYRLFKGQPKYGDQKQIEPIGGYNFMDVLTPLLYYLFHCK